MALPQVQNQGGLGDIAQLLQSLGPLFGTGKTGSSSSSSTGGKAGDLGQADDLIQQILGSVNDGNLDALTQNVLERAKQTFAPANISSSAAGVRGYSDTVHADLKNQAMARATAEAMSVRLQAQGAAQKTAAGLVDTKLQTNKTVANQQQSKTGTSPAGKALALLTPAAMIFNQFKRKPGSTEKPIDGSLKDETGNVSSSGPEDINSAYGNPGGADTSGAGGAFPVQDFGDDSLILNATESTIPAPVDFGNAAPLDAAAADAPSDLSVDFGNDVPMDIPASDVPADGVDPSVFDNFNLSDVDFFADGGVVPAGRRPKPVSYDEEAQVSKNVNAPRLATGSLAEQQNTATVAKRPGRALINPNDLLANPTVEGSDTGLAPMTSFADNGPAPHGLSTGIGIAAGLMGATVPLGLVFSLLSMLANANDGAIEGQSGQESLASMNGVDALTDALSQNAGPEEGFGPDDAGNSGFNDSADNSSSNDGGRDGEGDGGGGDGGGDGGGEFDGGIQDAANTKESSGIDKKLIHVTPGEAVLPVDTVQALGEDFIDQLIAATHTPLKRRANGRR